ncbi:MAG: NAD(P)/FAD-dependent oxidoreductase [Chloroflexota bacterium]|uniref:FAD/NAD(P)-binding domain-containing protein n=1 Tax=marine metagenome TaxID=408172 RepID=A0A381VUZ9_9ZZZZ|nr:NAD(P)/FAD-dependent oxidoreductase [Chloroflexota bacterium]
MARPANITESEGSGGDFRKMIQLDALIVGTGFAGMYMLYRLRSLGLKVLAVDEASGVGGTWYWNRYPGARCDVESMEYSYSFSEELQQEWEWSDRYSVQPEILEYANHVADKFNLRSLIRFNSRITSAHYDEDYQSWDITTEGGEIYKAKYCVMATGTLSSVNNPKFDGWESFQGDWYVTGRWPHSNVDFAGKTVGIIGTGSSAVQAIPVIAGQAKHLTVFQRTPNYSIPANNRPLDSQEVSKFKRDYSSTREKARQNRAGIASMVVGNKSVLEVTEEERVRELEKRWAEGGTNFLAAFNDIGIDEGSNEIVAEFVRSKIRKTVKDPATAALLAPTNTIGCKRLCADTDYYETYNRPNVTLLDVNKTPIVKIVERGVETTEAIYNFDVIIYAIGFDAMTGALLSIDIAGRSGLSLKDKWSEGPKAYLGLTIEGFPNMFTITGPGSPSVLSNMMTSIEQHVDWISRCIDYMEKSGKNEIEALPDFENDWIDHVEETASETLRYSCNSWYVGANIPGKRRIFMPYSGGLDRYTKKCNEVAARGYEGFQLS